MRKKLHPDFYSVPLTASPNWGLVMWDVLLLLTVTLILNKYLIQPLFK